MSGIGKIFRDVKLDWISFVALLGIAGLVWAFFRFAAIDMKNSQEAKERDSTIARFSPFIKEYSRYSTTESVTGPTYVKGRVIVVGLGEFQVHWLPNVAFRGRGGYTQLEHPQPFIEELYFELPEDMRARTPAEMETLILLEWHRDVVGRYEPGEADAYQFQCTLTVIDRSRETIVGRQVFRGDMPPPRAGSTTPFFGRLPLEEIARYVADLPRR